MKYHARGAPIAAFVFTLLLALAAGCTGTPGIHPVQTPVEKTPLPSETPVTAGPGQSVLPGTGIAESSNRFGADLYRELAQDNLTGDGAIFFSPFSVSSALALTYEGARGTTAGEIRSVLHFPANDTAMREGFAALDTGINGRHTGYTLSTADALWAEKTFALLPEYVRTAEQTYGANVTNLDFSGEPEASRLTINSWVAGRTDDKIRDLLAPGSIAPSTRLVITNAVYFKGSWQRQFDSNQTADAPFRTLSGSTATVRMMQQTGEDAVYPYAETSDLQMLSLPYNSTGGNGLSMVILLPKNDNLAAAELCLDPANLSALEQSASSRRVMVYFPKFTLETEYSLPKVLERMGMPMAFSPSADFSGMDGRQDLYISDVIHKAYIDVDEEGTEAAAATAVVILEKAMAPGTEKPVPVFRADHPFIFLIQDNTSGAVLFEGRVVDPGSA